MNITDIIPPQNLAILKTAGFNKITAVMNGVDEVTIKEAVQIVATKAFLKRAEQRLIAAGIHSLAVVRGEKTAENAQADLALAILRHAVPGVALGGAASYLASPNDPQQELRNVLQGMALGGVAGAGNALYQGSKMSPVGASGMAQGIHGAYPIR